MTTESTRTKAPWVIFMMAFGSFGLLFFGTGTVVLTFLPVLANQFTDEVEYFSELPLAPDREDKFADLSDVPARVLYPPVRANLDNVAKGNWIRIPTIGVAVPLVMSASMQDSDVLSVLDQGAALYPNGVLPGHLGNTFVSAHSTGQPWKGKYRFAFLKIDQVEAGNEVHLDYNGTRYTYRITDKDIVVPAPDFRVESGRPMPTITFMTCWPLWTTDKRMLVRGELTSITQLEVQS